MKKENKGKPTYIKLDGEIHNVKEWAEILGVSTTTILRRRKEGKRIDGKGFLPYK